MYGTRCVWGWVDISESTMTIKATDSSITSQSFLLPPYYDFFAATVVTLNIKFTLPEDFKYIIQYCWQSYNFKRQMLIL